jgi:hypothetical protein
MAPIDLPEGIKFAHPLIIASSLIGSAVNIDSALVWETVSLVVCVVVLLKGRSADVTQLIHVAAFAEASWHVHIQDL